MKNYNSKFKNENSEWRKKLSSLLINELKK